MAQNQIIVTCPVGVWTQLTNADVTVASFQVRKAATQIRFTADATQPDADDDAGYIYGPMEGEKLSALSDITPLAGAVRIWAKPCGAASEVFVDHN